MERTNSDVNIYMNIFLERDLQMNFKAVDIVLKGLQVDKNIKGSQINLNAMDIFVRKGSQINFKVNVFLQENCSIADSAVNKKIEQVIRTNINIKNVKDIPCNVSCQYHKL